MTFSRHTTFPGQPSGYPLNPEREWLGIVIPEATTNLFTNPSWETNTSNWTATSDGSSGTPYARSASAQYKGAYCAVLTIRPTNGTYVQIVGPSVTIGNDYTISFYVKRSGRAVPNLTNVKAVVNGSTVDFDSIEYVADGWWRCVKFFRATVTTAPGIRVQGSPSTVFYVDAAQLEQKSYVTTYCDGDQKGLLLGEPAPAFYWNGAPHASTSTRRGTTRAGGVVVNIAQFGFTILSIIGLGLSPLAVISTPLGLADGHLYQRAIREAREFSIVGAFYADTNRELSAKRGELLRALSPRLTGSDQPLVLHLQRFDARENAVSDVVEITASYTDGLTGQEEGLYSERAGISFRQYLPLLKVPASRAVTIASQQNITNAGLIVQKTPGNGWSAVGSGLGGAALQTVLALANGPDGRLYAGGLWTTAPANLGRFDGSSWSSIGALSASGYIRVLKFAPNGDLYAGGSFTSIGGTAANNIARYDGTNWSALGSGVNSTVWDIAFDFEGRVYAVGSFTTAGGGAANNIARWNGSTWSTIGTGPTGASDTINTILTGPDGNIYVGGSFTAMNGVSAASVAKYTVSTGTWSALGSSIPYIDPNAQLWGLTFDYDGTLYAFGDPDPGVTAIAGGIARWTGSAWVSAGTFNDTVTEVLPLGNGRLLTAGQFTSDSNLSYPSPVAYYSGSAWTPADVNPGPDVASVILRPDGTIVLGYFYPGSTTITAAGSTTVTNPGISASDIKFVVTGPSSGSASVYQLTNETTGKKLAFDVSLLPGETLTVRVASGTITAVSSFRGPIPSAILPSSDSNFDVIRGSNTLTFFASNSTVSATLEFTPVYESFSGVTLDANRL